jgi:RNA-binding protein 5/10
MLTSAGQSRQFAFAQFVGIPEARRFLEKYYPYISLYGAYDPSRSKDTEGSKVRIAFSRDKDDRDKPGKSEDDWKCEVVCFSKGCIFIPTDKETVLSGELLPSNLMFPM